MKLAVCEILPFLIPKYVDLDIFQYEFVAMLNRLYQYLLAESLKKTFAEKVTFKLFDIVQFSS